MDRSPSKPSVSDIAGADEAPRHWSRDGSDARSPSQKRESVRKRRGPGLSHIGAMVLDFLPLTEEARSATSLSTRARDLLDEPRIEQSEFLVCKGGLCVPTEGVLRVESYRGADYVVGHSSWERCRSRAHARRRLAARVAEIDPHDLASEAIAAGDPDGDETLWSDVT